MGKIIVFSSFIHGSGRSTLKKKLEEYLKKKGYKVLSISVGEIFRELAFKRNKSIEDFVKELKNNPKIDLEIDKEIYEKVKKEKDNYDFILIDSNLAPYYLKDSIKILVRADVNVISERIFKNKRFGDKEYRSIEEVKKEILERSENDRIRYKILSEMIDDKFWKEVYLSYYKKRNVFDIVIDNNDDLEKVFEKLLNELKRFIEI